MLNRLFVIRYLLGKSKSSVVKTIAIISVCGISIGVLAMVVVLSVMNGFDDGIKNRLLGAEPHIVVKGETPGLFELLKSHIGENGQIERFAKQDIVIRTLDGIFSGAEAEGFEMEALAHLGKKTHHAVEVFDSGHISNSSKKSELENTRLSLGPKEIAVGVDLARSLGIFEGDEVSVLAPESLLYPAGELPLYEKAKVRALLRTDVYDIDSRVVFYDVSKGLRKLSDSASLERGFEVRLNNPDDAEKVAAEIRDFDLIKNSKIKIDTWRTRNAALFYSLKMEKSLMGLFLALTILVSSFSVVSVLVLLVTEKRRDMGILMGMGATKAQVRSIFMSIGTVLGFVGIGSGTILGLFICLLLQKYPIIKLPDIYYDTTVPVRVDFLVIAGVVVLGTLLTILGTLIPVWRISENNPIDAIRYGGT
jgi:lipoprotein-releasing system permease protein